MPVASVAAAGRVGMPARVVRQRLHSVRSGIFGKPHLGHFRHCVVSINGEAKKSDPGIDPQYARCVVIRCALLAYQGGSLIFSAETTAMSVTRSWRTPDGSMYSQSVWRSDYTRMPTQAHDDDGSVT